MSNKPVLHPVSARLALVSPDVFEPLYLLFTHIGRHWDNLPEPERYRSELFVFVQNRINLYPIYQSYYSIASEIILSLSAELGERACFEKIFTDPFANMPPVDSDLSILRQKVSNEFIDFQLSIGGFRAFGAKNYPGYIGGSYIPAQPVPYRIMGEGL